MIGLDVRGLVGGHPPLSQPTAGAKGVCASQRGFSVHREEKETGKGGREGRTNERESFHSFSRLSDMLDQEGT